MKNVKTIILIVAFVLVIAVAGFFYNNLKDRVGTNGLMSVPQETQPATETPAEPSEPAQTQMPEETTQPTEGPEADGAPTAPEELPEETEAPEYPAPPFTVYDGEGNAVTLESLQGKPVILNFWATWCGYCVQEMPEFQAAFETYGEDIQFMMLNATDGYQETQEKAENFILGKGYTFPVYYDLDMSACQAFGVNAFPITYFLDARGNLIAYGQGALTLDVLEQGIRMIYEPQEEAA